MSIKQNITSLQSLLEQVNALPDAGGIELPELTNEGIADDLVTGKELINSDGNVVTGTNPYEKVATDTEVNTQADLIAQIKSTVDNLPEAGSGDGSVSYDTCTVNITAPSNMYGVVYLTVNANGELEPTTITTNTTSYSFTCVCNSFITIGISPVSHNLINASYLGWIYTNKCRVFVITASNGETATITFQSDGGAE